MATNKSKRNDIDRFTGQAITSVSKNTPEQQRAVDEINSALRGKKPAPKRKK